MRVAAWIRVAQSDQEVTSRPVHPALWFWQMSFVEVATIVNPSFHVGSDDVTLDWEVTPSINEM